MRHSRLRRVFGLSSRNRAATVAIVISLAVVTGPCIVLVSVLSKVGRHPAVESPREVVLIRSAPSYENTSIRTTEGLSFPQFSDVRQELGGSVEIAGSVRVPGSMTIPGESRSTIVHAVTDRYFARRLAQVDLTSCAS